jgi:hypothetical protein
MGAESEGSSSDQSESQLRELAREYERTFNTGETWGSLVHSTIDYYDNYVPDRIPPRRKGSIANFKDLETEDVPEVEDEHQQAAVCNKGFVESIKFI